MARASSILVGVGTILFAMAQLACGSEATVGPGSPDARSMADAASVPEATPCQSRAGTRLTRRYLGPALGARQELQIIDTEFDQACVFKLEQDGSYTCYPAQTGGALYFEDASCASPIVGVALGSTPKIFTEYSRFGDTACFLGSYYRRIGVSSAVIGGQSAFTQDSSGACVSATTPSLDYYLAGPELPISSFVNATREALSETSRLSSAYFAADDGSSMCDSQGFLRDKDLAVACTPNVGSDSEVYCMPAGSLAIDVFTDSLCTEVSTVVTVTSCQEAPSAYAQSFETTACTSFALKILAVGAMELDQRYDQAGNTCTAYSGENRFFSTLEVVEYSELVALTNAVEEGDGRLKRNVLVDSEGSQFFRDVWRDDHLATDCQFAASADGSLRCLPSSLEARGFHANANCTSPITLALRDSCQEGRSHFTVPSPLGTRVQAALPHGDPVFASDGAACNPVSGSFFLPGFELAPSTFVSATVLEL